MMPAPSEQSVFAEAILLPTPQAQAAYLDGACGGDAALRERVEALLQAARNAGLFLEEPPAGVAGNMVYRLLANGLGEQAGDHIGRYKLLQKIGEGGCGVVYMAEQEEPVRRRVALKIIKLGMDTKSVIARFEAERQALALMDHPNIAKVLDGGATSAGRLYFVMELVRGVRITDFCDEVCLSTHGRLRLFIEVCQAIQHAHQKGIIHRDIKPSNILVTLNDDQPVPKVIDFGIAKAIEQKLTDKTLFTEFQALVGTPAYMSPEQAEMSSVDIDTRGDIYSLGVLLYELLAGRTPFKTEQLLSSGLDEMRRMICSENPPRPSACLASLDAAEATTLSARRQLNVPEWAGVLRGDLDWIVMKCLEKDRSRRYETASALAEDIQRHLKCEPIMARPPGNLYSLQKLAQRKRGALIAACAVLLALFVAVISMATSNARIRGERNQKDAALNQVAKALETARASELHAREQLFSSLHHQALARRSSRTLGQRSESLEALAQAARIRPQANLRDNAIAALALPDIQFGSSWKAWTAEEKGFAYDSRQEQYARLLADGSITIRAVTGDRELHRLEPNAITEGSKSGSLSFSPDGRSLSWLDDRGRLGVWRCDSGESVLREAPAKSEWVSFSPDNRYLAVAHESSVTCYDLETSEAITTWRAVSKIFSINFNPDGRRLFVGYADTNVVTIHRVQDGALKSRLSTSSRRTFSAWHTDGELLATGGGHSTVEVWNTRTERRVAALAGHVGDITFLSFDRSGKLLISLALDGVLRLWQPSPARLWLQLPVSGWLGFSQAGHWSGAMSPAYGQAQLWRVVTSDEYHTFLNTFAPGDSIFCEADISSDGTLLALGTSDGARLWDVARGRELAWLGDGEITTALFLGNGHELLTCGEETGLLLWPIMTNSSSIGDLRIGPPEEIALPFRPLRIAGDRGGKLLAVVGKSPGETALLNLVNGQLVSKIMPHAQACFLALGPDNGQIVTSGWHTDQVKLWDGPSGALLNTLRAGGQSRVFITPNGDEMILSRFQEFTFYKLPNLEVSRRFTRERGLYPGYVAFSLDGKLVAMEMAPGIIHLKELSSGQTIAELEDPYGDRPTWMSFTPDSTQLLVVASYSGAVHRWDLRALRTRLKAMDLDWKWPEFSAVSAGQAGTVKSEQPIRIQVLPGAGSRAPTATLPSNL